jgi:hypothetical protein
VFCMVFISRYITSCTIFWNFSGSNIAKIRHGHT